jgi:hypothetical protein
VVRGGNDGKITSVIPRAGDMLKKDNITIRLEEECV